MHTNISLVINGLRIAALAALSGLVVCLALMATATHADEAAFVEGEHYTRVNPVVSVEVAAGHIEVREFFWYGCPHCYALEPYIEKWKRPDDVVFVRTPALLGGQWIMHAYTYYALEALGRLDLHNTVFDALHRDRLRLTEAGDMARFLEQHGVDGDEFRAAMESFLVKTKIKNAEIQGSSYLLRSVPTMVVNGRYSLSTGRFSNYQDVMKVVDFLVAKERERMRQQQTEPLPAQEEQPKAHDDNA